MDLELKELSNKDIVFIGKKVEGEALEDFIRSKENIKSFQTITITDENKDSYDKQLQSMSQETSVVIKSTQYPGRLIAVPYTTPVKLFFECVKQIGAKTIGVTGTRGKSTTASLIYRMLQQGGIESLLGGDIGVPFIDLISQINNQTVVVLELTSFDLAELDVNPDMAVLTNFSRDHIDYHGSLENYWEAKHNIIRNMTAESSIIYNPQTELVLHWLAESEAKKIEINPSENVDMSKSKLIGEQNKFNYLMAKTAAQAFGVDAFSCQHILKNFKPVAHRLETVRSVKGITFIDDAVASDPESAVAGIAACIREVGPVGCVILGGKDNDSDFSELVKLLYTLMIPNLVLFPDTGTKIKELLPETYTPGILETQNMDEAVKWIAENCPSGSVCLLSSASPSNSIWKNFEEKGQLYQKAVLELPT